jgi:Protein of unknown function (DUF2934)
MSKSSKGYQEPSHEEIAAYAQSIYEQDGRPEGKSVEHWLQAETQLIAERKAQAAQAPAKAVAKAAPAAPQANRKSRDAGWQASSPAPEKARANAN